MTFNTVLLHKLQTPSNMIIFLYEPGISYDIKSTAALKIMQEFKGFWVLSRLFLMTPGYVRNVIYDFISKKRYKWFGKFISSLKIERLILVWVSYRFLFFQTIYTAF